MAFQDSCGCYTHRNVTVRARESMHLLVNNANNIVDGGLGKLGYISARIKSYEDR